MIVLVWDSKIMVINNINKKEDGITAKIIIETIKAPAYLHIYNISFDIFLINLSNFNFLISFIFDNIAKAKTNKAIISNIIAPAISKTSIKIKATIKIMYDNITEIDVLKIFLFNFDTQAIYVAKHTTTVKLKIHHE